MDLVLVLQEHCKDYIGVILSNINNNLTNKVYITTKEMISIFSLRTFHLYVATLQQHPHMEYISLSWYEISELVVPIMMSLIEGCC